MGLQPSAELGGMACAYLQGVLVCAREVPQGADRGGGTFRSFHRSFINLSYMWHEH